MKHISLVLDARMVNHSGIGTYIQSLLEALVGHPSLDISLIGHAPELRKILGERLDMISVLPGTAPIYSIKEQLQLPCIIPGCDIFWSPHYNVPLLPIRARTRVVTIHDVYHLAYKCQLRPLEKIYASLVLPLAIRLSAGVITVSQFSKTEILSYTHVAAQKVTVIPNGVAAERFRHAQADLELLRRYGLTEYVLFVGNVKPHKNITGLLKAMGYIRRDYPGLKLLVVGKRTQFITGVAGLDKLIDELDLADQVVFSDYVNDADLCALYAGARMLVFPSFYEGFGLPPLEAMAAGTPVVASRAASIPEVCGDAAWYVDPHNPQDIAQGIMRILQDAALRDELIRKGRLRVDTFSWQTSAQRHMRLFESLL